MFSQVREEKRVKRHRRIRKKIFGTVERPRLSVHRSHLNLQAQLLDDLGEKTLFSSSTLDKGFRSKEKKKQFGNVEGSKKFAAYLAELLKKKKIQHIVFDRGGYAYHGRVRALAEELRAQGIQF